MVGGFRFIFGGEVVIADTVHVAAEVKFRLELAGDNPGIELVINGSMQLGPLGSVDLVDSGFRINRDGLVARFDLKINADFGHGAGLEFNVTALFALNTTGRVQTLGSSSVDPGLRLHLEGSVTFLGFAKARGFVDLTISPEGLQLLFGVSFNLGGLTSSCTSGSSRTSPSSTSRRRAPCS